MMVLKCFFLLLITSTIWAAEDCESHFVTHQELKEIMETEESLAKFVQPLNQMLKDNNLDCPLRIAAFLSQVRYETNGLKIFSNADGSGAFHMNPNDIRVACADNPEVKSSFSHKYADCAEDDPCRCGKAEEIGDVLQDPKYAFQTAAWLFSRGASILRGSQCANLSKAADLGLGSEGDVKSGFHHITRCLHGYDNNEGIDERIKYYNVALGVVKNWIPKKMAANEDENQELTTRTFQFTFWQLLAIGIAFFVVFVALIIAIIEVKKKKKRSEGG